MRVEIVAHGVLDANAYVAHAGGRAVVIDPGGADAAPLLQAVERLQVFVEYVLITHEHFDHARQADAVRRATGARIVCSAGCARGLRDPKKNFSLYWDDAFTIDRVDLEVAAPGCELDWAGRTIRVLATPGHTSGSVCFAIGEVLFSGDTLLQDGRKRAHIPGSDAGLQRESVRLLAARLGPETTVYPGHGGPFQLRQASELPRGVGLRP